MMHITAIIPARNEARAITAVIKALQALQHQGKNLIHHIIVVDNLSSDNTAMLARNLGATVVAEPQPGYGSACQAGIRAIDHTDLVLFIDGDHSCDCSDIPNLINAINRGADLAIGSRSLGRIAPRAMTRVQRWGTALVCGLIQLRTKHRVTDLGPLRIIRFNRLLQLEMQDRRYGWTAEMQIKALRHGFNIAEVPATLHPRIGTSKISGTWRGTLLAAFDLLKAALTL